MSKNVEISETQAAAAVPPEQLAAKKEDYEEVGNTEKNRVNGARAHGIVTILAGLGLFGSTVPVLVDLENYNALRGPLSEGGSPLAFELVLPFVIMGAAALMIISGVVGIFGYARNRRTYIYIAMASSTLCSGAAFFAGIQISSTLEQLFFRLQGSPVSSDIEFNDRDLSVLDFTAAIFNTCCLPVYDSRAYSFGGFNGELTDGNGNLVDDNQREVRACGQDLAETCPSEGDERMFPDIVTTLLGAAEGDSSPNDNEILGLLCHCYADVDRFQKFQEIFEEQGSCEKFRGLIVNNAGAREIPLPNGGISFNTVLLGLNAVRQEYSNRDPLEQMAVVGKMLPPNSLFDEPREDIGYSCGLGYAKAVALTMYFYITDRTAIIVGGSLACAGIGIAASLLLILFWFTGGSSVDDDDEYDNDYVYQVE